MLIFYWTFGNKFQWNLNQTTSILMKENAFELIVCEMTAILSQPQCVNGRQGSLTFIVYGLSQWEMTLQCNIITLRLRPYTNWSLGDPNGISQRCQLMVSSFTAPGGSDHMGQRQNSSHFAHNTWKCIFLREIFVFWSNCSARDNATPRAKYACICWWMQKYEWYLW